MGLILILLKNSNIDLIEAYLLNNQTINDHTELTKYLVNYHLSRSNIEQPCKIFSKIDNTIEDKYLSKNPLHKNAEKLEGVTLVQTDDVLELCNMITEEVEDDDDDYGWIDDRSNEEF